MTRAQQTAAPTLAQRQLANRLREARIKAGKRQEDAALALNCDVSKIFRVESGRTAAKVADVRELCRIYGMDPQETEDLVRLARGARDRGWTDDYLDIIPSTLSMLGDLETQAAGIHDYSVEVIHGLLQSEAYAEILIGLATELDDTTRQQRLAFRLERQKRVLHRDEPPQLRFVLHESALLAQVGGPRLMSQQRGHLRDLHSRGIADVRVWPVSAGLHRWMGGSFTMLTFAQKEDPDVIYVENPLEANYYERTAQVSKITKLYAEIWRRATPLEEYLK